MIEDRISQSRLLHFSPHHWMQAGEGALPVHLSTDPLTPSPASEDALSLPAAQGLHQEPPAHSQVLLPITGMNLFSKICLQPVGTALHEAGLPGALLELQAVRTLNFDFLLYGSGVSFKASNQPKDLTPSPSSPPWIQK